MVTARKPTTTTHTDRLLELYRAELEHWTAHEMLDGLLECSPNMLAGTVARCVTKLKSPRCSKATIANMVDEVLDEAVTRGYTHDVEAYIERQATARAEAEAEPARERLRAAVDRLARRPDAGVALELVARVMEALTGEVPLDAAARAALVDQLRAATPDRKPARRAVAGIEAALARKGAA